MKEGFIMQHRSEKQQVLHDKLWRQHCSIIRYAYNLTHILQIQYFNFAFLYTAQQQEQAITFLTKCENKIERCINRCQTNILLIKAEKIRGLQQFFRKSITELKNAKKECTKLKEYIFEFTNLYKGDNSDIDIRKEHLLFCQKNDEPYFQKLQTLSFELGNMKKNLLFANQKLFANPILGEYLSRITEIFKEVIEMNISDIAQNRFVELAKPLYDGILDFYSFSFSFRKSVTLSI